MLVPPLLQRAEHHLQLPAGRGQPVGEPGPGPGLAVRLPGQHAELDQGGQPVRQDVGGHAEPVPELGEPARAEARDVSILINNAGSGTGASLLTGDLADIRLELDTHFLGTLAVTRAFAPQLAEHEHSAVLNVLSVLSWVSFPAIGAYCAAKAAEWSLTNALRVELAPQGTRVSSLHVGYMDTDLARHVTDPKSDPADIARIALDGIAAGETEIVADEISKRVLAGLSSGVRGLYPHVA